MKRKKYNITTTIVYGKHDELRDFIYSLLREYAKLSKKNIEKLLTDDVMIEFKKAFTSPNANQNYNYEFYEMLGDATANNCIVWYFQRRFFSNIETVVNYKGTMSPLAIMGRLKQEYASVRTFSKFARELNFLPYITMTDIEFNSPTKVLEDVFESFFGCLVYHIDKIFAMHIGFTVVYSFLQILFDKEDIQITKESLYEPKSILNEDITKFPKNTIKLQYISRDNPNMTVPTERFLTRAVIFDMYQNVLIETPEFVGKDKQSNEQKSAKYLLQMNDYIQLKKRFNI
jgi:dsRNA-specific ribonuclease